MNDDSAYPTDKTHAYSHSKPQVLRLKEVCKVTGLGRSFIYQLQAQRQFPHSIKIGLRAVGWLDSEVREWIDTRARISRKQS